jgi:hypothetical protein
MAWHFFEVQMIVRRFFCDLFLATFVLTFAFPAILRAQTPANQTQPFPAGAAPLSADYRRLLDTLNITLATNLPATIDDPNRPPNTRPATKGRYTDQAGNQVQRSLWGHWSNFDEAKASPFPIPDPLLLKNGGRVSDAQTWWTQRRPEILKDFQTEMYGKIPENTPAITWEVTGTNPVAYGGKVLIKSVTGHIDNAAYPSAKPAIQLMMHLPAAATGPVPMMVVVSAGPPPGGRGSATQPAGLNPRGNPNGVMQQLLALGWGYATFDTAAVQKDSADGLTSGIIGLMSKGQPRQPDDWGVLAAWSWGLSRALDYLQTDKSVDAKHLGVEGHSRWGKTALLAAAYDPRWAICFASCSGEGGAKLSRRDWGETLDDVSSPGEYYWMAENFVKFAGHWNDLPVDSHELIGLVAPRPLFVTGGTTDRWADPHGEFLAAVAASPIYELLGSRGVGATQMPAPDVELISGSLGFRYHEGGHTDTLDWPTFLKFAQKQFNLPKMQP